MDARKEMVSLDTLSDGAAVEAFNHELGRVLENILDPNTSPTAAREITLKVKIKPTDDRALGTVEFGAVAKLAPTKPLTTRLYFGRDSQGAVATEYDRRQPGLPLDGKDEKKDNRPESLRVMEGGQA